MFLINNSYLFSKWWPPSTLPFDTDTGVTWPDVEQLLLAIAALGPPFKLCSGINNFKLPFFLPGFILTRMKAVSVSGTWTITSFEVEKITKLFEMAKFFMTMKNLVWLWLSH